MSIQQILDLLAQVQAQLVALQASQAQFTQADLDKAVSDAVAPLSAQIADLQTQVGSLPGQVHDAILAEDARIAGLVKPQLDLLAQAISGLVVP